MTSFDPNAHRGPIHCRSLDQDAGRVPSEIVADRTTGGASTAESQKKRRKKGKSPTARTLEEMRKRGYLAQVVEHRVPFQFTTRDLYGVIDVLCIRENEIVGVQATSGDNVAARLGKIANHEHTPMIRKAGIRILVHGWRKAANGRWTLREVDCS